MEIATSQDDSIRVLKLTGRLDQASADNFHQALIPHLNDCSANGKPLLLDFSGVEYISSVGLRVMILAAKQVKAQNGRVAIANLTPIVAEVFQIGRFNLVFQVFQNIEDALKFLNQ